MPAAFPVVIRLMLPTLLAALLAPTAAAADAPRWAERLFANGDGDRDGRLDRAEIELVVLALEVSGRPAPSVDAVFDRFDADGDGAIARAELGLADAPPVAPDDARAAAAGPDGMRVVADLPYRAIDGVDPSLVSLDLYLPEQADDAPVVVFVHGGGWAVGDKGRVHHKPACFVGRGWIVASVNYRLSPAVRHPAHAEDVAASVAWLHAHLAEHGGDPRRLVLMGHSAGAHLAALVALDPQYLAAHDLERDAIAAAVLLDGACYDLPRRMALAGPQLKDLVERAFGAEGPAWHEASPARRVAPGAPPVLVTASSQRPAARDQAERLAAALRTHAVPHRSLAFDKSHAEMNEHAGRRDDPLTAAILAFLDEHAPTPDRP